MNSWSKKLVFDIGGPKITCLSTICLIPMSFIILLVKMFFVRRWFFSIENKFVSIILVEFN